MDFAVALTQPPLQGRSDGFNQVELIDEGVEAVGVTSESLQHFPDNFVDLVVVQGLRMVPCREESRTAAQRSLAFAGGVPHDSPDRLHDFHLRTSRRQKQHGIQSGDVDSFGKTAYVAQNAAGFVVGSFFQPADLFALGGGIHAAIDMSGFAAQRKGKSGVLKSVASRQEFLSDPSHRIRFVFLPKHSSWLNQIEIIFGIVNRRVMRNGNFTSTDALKERLSDFGNHFNDTFAGPIDWKYTGQHSPERPLQRSKTWKEEWARKWQTAKANAPVG